MITNHGIHDWRISPGLPDTGGQNIFVNDMTIAMIALGCRVTIANRGGFPHPLTGQARCGLDYIDGERRILYLEDGHPEFVRKEDMASQISDLSSALTSFFQRRGEKAPDMILSHYWDGALLGNALNASLAYKRPHAWIPHSLGAVKKRNMPPSTWPELRVDERIETEKTIPDGVDVIGSTSTLITDSLINDYGYTGHIAEIPPGVDSEKFHPRDVSDDDAVWAYLASRSGLKEEEIRSRKIICEISRTDETKRKGLLIEAFNTIAAERDDVFLAVAVADGDDPLAQLLKERISASPAASRIASLGAVPELLPSLYAAAAVYATPSVMEGFGMAAQEAASSGIPVVASDKVPFVKDFLLGKDTAIIPTGTSDILAGEAALIVQADDTAAFSNALSRILDDSELAEAMGRRAREITAETFAWPSLTKCFLEESGFPLPSSPGVAG